MLSPSFLLSPGPRAELHVEVVPNKDIWNEKQCPPAVYQWSYGTTGGLRPRGFGMQHIKALRSLHRCLLSLRSGPS